MHRWYVEIEGPEKSLKALPRLLGDRATLSEQDGTTVLLSPLLDSLDDPSEVADAAYRILVRASRLMNATGYLTGEIEPKDVYCNEEGHCHGWNRGVKIFLRVRSRGTADEFESFIQSSTGPRLLDIAESDHRVQEVLAFIGYAEPDWGDIYSAFETIVRSLRERDYESSEWSALEQLGWLGKGEAARLKRTANYHRHALGGNTTLPDRPYSLAEAGESLRRVTRRWLSWLVA